ncbi:MAG: uroporphyrinogen decarboxylase family protein [Victivallaceae bacterium]|nr:uroporphyrinogen decarboxylase family protein [Victivallaceae bacterium]
MNDNELLQLAKNSKRRLSAPLMGFPGAALTGTSLKENLCNPDVQLKSLSALNAEVKADIIMPMMDLSIECETLGLPVVLPDNESPSVEEHPVKNSADLEKLKIFNLKSGRIRVFPEVVTGLKKRSDAKVCAYVCGPFTLAGLLMGATEILMASYDDAQNVRKIISFCEGVVKTYSQTLEACGADAICILDPTAVMLSPDTFAEFAGDYVKRVSSELNVPAILHICGNTTHLVRQMAATGVQGLSLDMDINVAEILKTVPDNVVIIGNIDSKALMPGGTPEEIIKATKNLLEATAAFDNFIPATGCDLPPETPLENIIAFSETVRQWTR